MSLQQLFLACLVPPLAQRTGSHLRHTDTAKWKKRILMNLAFTTLNPPVRQSIWSHFDMKPA